MGCVYSRPEFENSNPRVFQVWNVDGDGRTVKPGKIEVTESQLILYQKGDITVRWPLRSLRRYGFDAELFSFECGRRCPTGPGVYAFRCRRAEALFNVLQECIQSSGGGNGNISIAAIDDQISLSTINGPTLNANGVLVSSNGTVHDIQRQSPAVDSSGYLEPITVSSHNVQCPHAPAVSRANGIVSIHSPDGATLEWPSNGHHQASNGLTTCCICKRGSKHHYVNKDLADQASGKPGTCLMHQYVNSSVISSDPSKQCSCVLTRCSQLPQNTYVNSTVTSTLSLSPGHLPCASGCCTMNCMNCVDINTNYAKLDDLLKQEQSVKRQKEQQHFYVNVKPELSANCIMCTSGSAAPLSTVESSKELAKSASQVNYAVLDLEKNPSGNAVPASPATGGSVGTAILSSSVVTSPVRTPEGYAQIDFDRTVALSNSAIPCPSNDDSIRKTRHNAVIPSCSTPS